MIVPEVVREQADAVRAVGLEPAVEQVTDRLWRVSVVTDRVLATADYKRSSKRRWYWSGGGLWVDGVPRALVEDMAQLARLVADPDGTRVEVSPVPAPRKPGEAPAVVQQAYWLLVRKFGSSVSLGCDGAQWVTGLDLPRGSFRIRYRRAQRGWDFALELVIDGVDRSDEVRSSISAAMALLLAPGEGPETPSVMGEPSGGARSNSVEERRHSVIRN